MSEKKNLIENGIRTYFGDRVIVEELPLDETTASGIFRPEAHRDNRDRKNLWKARVVAFGLDSRAKEAFEIDKDSVVLVEPTFKDVDPFFENGKKYLRVPDEYIAGVLA